MATSPKRIYCIYKQLCEDAETVRDFQIAKGEKVSGTVHMLLKADREKLLQRWGEEMQELIGVLEGTHDDPWIMESTQCFYWASLYAVTADVAFADLNLEGLRQQAACEPTLAEPGMILSMAQRLVEAGAEKAKPQKLFLLWWAADNCYRHSPRFPQTWDIEQIMEADLQDMKKRAYLAPILELVEEDCC